MSKLILLTGTFIVFSLLLAAQSKKVIVVIGSSTAAGMGASTPDSSWVNLTKKYFQKQGLIDTIYNIALSGSTTYVGMPTGFVPPSGRPSSDPRYNVTTALQQFHADVVLVNYPTNDAVATYTLKETLSNLRTIYQTVVNAGKICYITTSQPRTSATTQQEMLLKTERDSILTEFPFHSFNFYNPVVAADSLTINPVYNFDGIHVNNGGHRLFFQSVQAAGIFASGFSLAETSYTLTAVAQPQEIFLRWAAPGQTASGIFFIERSRDGISFEERGREQGSPTAGSWSWEDNAPLPGKGFYRIKTLSVSGAEQYSSIVSVIMPVKNWGIGNIFMADGKSQLLADIQCSWNQTIGLTVSTAAGIPVIHRYFSVIAPVARVTLDLSVLAPGVYFLTVSDGNANRSTRSFLKP